MNPEVKGSIQLPKGARILRNPGGEIIGLEIPGDGSWDYTQEGQDFLSGRKTLREEKNNNDDNAQ